ncbi:MAG TPA: hypothetical protein VMU01_10385 [Rhizomicrobium sp.]|nr:hypothetical protein [Rhizomicrobium sp.]
MSRESGYAMLAAVAGITAFALIGLQVLASSRASINVVSARAERAQLAASADAGFALAMDGLAADPAGAAAKGRTLNLEFANCSLAVGIEPESGKIPINQINDAKAKRLFAALGASGKRLDMLAESFKDWRNADADQDTTDPAYAALGIQPRHGNIETVEELIRLRGMDADFLGRLESVTTSYFSAGGAFNPDAASPLAAAVMSADDRDIKEDAEDPSVPDFKPEALDAGKLTGRFFTVEVEARDAWGGYLKRTFVVELTPYDAYPYRVRAVD